MEDNFRTILIVLSAVVITAIFIHGLWIIRKQKNPYKLKTSKNKITPINRDFDRKGFDQDGVGQVKVSNKSDMPKLDSDGITEQELTELVEQQVQLSKKQSFQQGAITPGSSKRKDDSFDLSKQVLDDSIEDDWFKEGDKPQGNKGELGKELTAVNNEPELLAVKKQLYIEPLYAQPVTHAKPNREPIKKVNMPSTKNTLKRSQMEIDFDNQLSEQAAESKQEGINKQATFAQQVKPQEPQVIILSVVMPANQQIQGAELLPSLLTLGLKYGDMNIFHRHEDNAGNGKVTFSLVNIMNPGSFDLDSMETFATRGVSLFMTLPTAGDSLIVFTQMLNAAKQLAQEFNGQVIDEHRNVMTKQTEQHYISKIRGICSYK